MFGVSPEKESQLRERMVALGIRDEDLEEKFVRSSGPGGQKVNKTSSAVHLKHLPSGTEVKVQSHRSQAMNRFTARRRLVERMEEERDGALSAEQQRIAKVRRQKRKRSKRAKNKMLDAKHKQANKKQGRKKVDRED